MNAETIKKIFQSPFNYPIYSREIVHSLFGCNDVLTQPELIDTSSLGDSEALHYDQVRKALAQYALEQQRKSQEDKPKIGSKDNDAKKAAAFLRDVRPSLPDDDARQTVDTLKSLVERGKYNQLADSLNRLSRKHKKTPLPIIEIVEQLEALKARYGQPDKETTPQTSAGITADIILSETFVYSKQ